MIQHVWPRTSGPSMFVIGAMFPLCSTIIVTYELKPGIFNSFSRSWLPGKISMTDLLSTGSLCVKVEATKRSTRWKRNTSLLPRLGNCNGSFIPLHAPTIFAHYPWAMLEATLFLFKLLVRQMHHFKSKKVRLIESSHLCPKLLVLLQQPAMDLIRKRMQRTLVIRTATKSFCSTTCWCSKSPFPTPSPPPPEQAAFEALHGQHPQIVH